MQSLNADEAARAGAWIEGHQNGFRAAEKVLDTIVADDEGGPLARVHAGVIGVALDPANEELRVAVDPSIADTERLQDALDTAVGAVANEPTLQVRVAPGCHSAQAVEDAYAYATSDEWIAPDDDAPTAIGVNAASSTVQVQLDESTSPSSRTALEASGHPTLSVADGGDLELWGRQNDASPHIGGAGIFDKVQYNSNVCTSAFTAKLPSGYKGGVTAGHCVKNDHKIRSGNKHYGKAAGKSGYPTFDMARIKRDGDVFNRRIYADPGSPSRRVVESAGNPSIGESLCQSGKTSLQTCGIVVIALSHQYLGRNNLAVGYKYSGPGSPGDSGAPVYRRNGDLARIRGMVIGGPLAGTTMYFHKVQTIANHLGITQIGA